MSDGGLIRLDAVIASRPAICLFEPSIEDGSRGAAATDEDHEYACARLVEAGVVPLTLLLPNPAPRKPELNPVNTRIAALCRKFDLPVISVDLSDIGILEGRFTGGHTTHEGAKPLADQIVPGIRSALSGFSLDEARGKLRTSRDIPISVQRLNPASWIRKEGFTFDLVLTAQGSKRVRFLQLQDVWPFSPILDLRFGYPGAPEPSFSQTVSVRDPYCHYTRRSDVTRDRG